MVGRVVAHDEIVEKIGEGGMGVLDKARDTRLGRRPRHLRRRRLHGRRDDDGDAAAAAVAAAAGRDARTRGV